MRTTKKLLQRADEQAFQVTAIKNMRDSWDEKSDEGRYTMFKRLYYKLNDDEM